MREIFRTPEFDEFIANLDEIAIAKIDYLKEILISQPVINTKVAKKLVNTNFYEVRVSVNNEYRIVTFAIDHDNINQCKTILFIDGFLKKSTKRL